MQANNIISSRSPKELSMDLDGSEAAKINGTMGDHVDGYASGYKHHLPSGKGVCISSYIKGSNGSSEKLPEPIAICGLAMRLPGGVRDAEGFWDQLLNGKDTRTKIPANRYHAKGFDTSLGKKGSIKTQYGYFLDDDLSLLDTSFFSMAKSELEKADPQQRQILEVARECLENAGEVGYRGKRIGCYVGTFGDDWLYSQSKESQYSGGYNLSGDLMIANRVSYEYDLRGPSLVIKTGCSASLIALHEACRALQSGDCTSALVAGTSLIMGPTTTMAMTQEGIISPEGSCKTFDAAADGFARGEAINAVFVKRLDDAIQDNSPIRGIIRNTGTNSDGKSQGLLTPNSKSQEALIRLVYEQVHLNPQDTGFVECHGTGTATGDPIETTAVGNVFGDKGVFIGSVKPNVGHSEGASGLTSLIKAILALENKTIPPNIKFSTPNAKIPFTEKRLKVPLKPLPWPAERAERISINSFGIGGSNAHVILDSSNDVQARNSSNSTPVDRAVPRLLTFSANSQNSLRQMTAKYQQYLERNPDCVADLAYTLSQRRDYLPYRCFSITGNNSIGKISSMTKVPGTTPHLIMIFTGQGAHWYGMGKDLVENDAHFRNDIVAMDSILQGLKHPPTWSLLDELVKPAGTNAVVRAEISQPVCTAIQIALVNILRRSGVLPRAVVGHSSGEIAAAYAASNLSMPDALIAAYYRGFVTREQNLVGGMAAIGLGAFDTSKLLVSGVVIACENSPESTTISGDLDQVELVIEKIKRDSPGTLARVLKVDMAYHSHHMKLLASRYLKFLEEELSKSSTPLGKDRVRFVSSITGKDIDGLRLSEPEYWVSNLIQPVRFNQAVSTIVKDQPENICLEVGPHSTLAGPLRQICAESKTTCNYVPTMLRSQNCVECLLSAFGQLYQQALSVDFATLIPIGKTLTDLPNYPWDHSVSFWNETRLSHDWRFREVGHHALLGQRIPESTSLAPSWRVLLELEDEPWLADHKVKDDIVFPFAGYVSMAGEAIRQISGSEEGYSTRHVIAHTALVLTDTKPTEMVTTLSRLKLTDSSDSDAYSFVIQSHAGPSWIKNCEGLVKPISGVIPLSSTITPQPRKVVPSNWYEIMARVGLVYGPEFQGITSLSASTTERRATAEITTTPGRHNPFPLHPATIDSCLQVAIAAMAQGTSRNFTQLAVPTLIQELDVFHGGSNLNVTAWTAADGMEMCIDCTNEGRPALRLRGGHLTPLDDEKPAVDYDRHAAARLEWYHDFDFMDNGPLLIPPAASIDTKRLLEELTLACLLDSAERLDALETCIPHFVKFRIWLRREVSRAKSGNYPIVEDAAGYVKMSRQARRQLIQDRMARLSSGDSTELVAKGILRICENAEGLFTGTVDTLELLMRDDVLTEIYNVVSFGFGGFVRMLSVTKPNLRVLEVGAGTGGTTELILRGLVSSGGNPAYSTYTYTDISAGFFPQAKERFAYAVNMEYRLFDISQDPLSQGFEAQSYDLILAPNVIHATPSLQESLRNLQPLLHPHGHLVLSEMCADARAPGYVFGNFSGWWLGESDNRLWEPYVHPDRWDKELKDAGFSGVDTVVYDAEDPYQYCAAIVTQPKQDAFLLEGRPLTILCSEASEGISQVLVKDLRRMGMQITTAKFGDLLPTDQDVISTMDLEGPFFDKITESQFSHLQAMLKNYGKQNFLWLMPPTQIRCKNPHAAQTIGLLRVLRAELALPFASLEIAPSETEFSRLVMQVYHKIVTYVDTERIAPDREFAVDDGAIKIGRYQPFSLEQELNDKTPADLGLVKVLEIAKPGLLETLHWIQETPQGELPSNQVEIMTRAVGLNFRDIMISMGVLSFGSDRRPLGLELAGVVRRVGADVHNVAVGDRVCAVAPGGCFATLTAIIAPLVVKIPDNLSFTDAATMPGCFTTAVQSLLHVGQLNKGHTVLIHSACGGVGIAAIQICQMIGAEVFATVGREDKVQFLMKQLKIPRSHIFNSRNDSFYPELMQETGGRGVDLVLNSLSGELLHLSWKCVAAFGKMVELGKRDLAGYGKLDMEPFLANRAYCCVDIAHAMKVRPESVGRIIEQWMAMYRLGKIQPIHPVATFEVSEIEQSFRYLQKGDHIGKAIVAIPEDVSAISSLPCRTSLHFDPEASYLLTGGLGGLGRSIASWTAEHGSRHLVFLSRSAGLGPDDELFFKELESMGCTAQAVQGRVEDQGDVNNAVSLASKPIKGVFHLAMILRDAPLLDMTYDEWTAVISPKVDGAWALHRAFSNHPLDFFIMTSSVVTLIDQPGQSNYAAANTFLESFCQYRIATGLPAAVLSICPVDDIGFVSQNPVVKRKLKSEGLYFLLERDLLDYVELAISMSSAPARPLTSPQHTISSWSSPSNIIMGLRSEVHLDDPSCQTSWRRDRRMGMYHNVRNDAIGSTNAASKSSALKSFLTAAASDPSLLDDPASATYLATQIGHKVFKIMIRPEDSLEISMSLAHIGLDSLMAIELRRWWKQVFGLDISVLEIMASGSFEGLGKVAVEGLKKKLGGGGD